MIDLFQKTRAEFQRRQTELLHAQSSYAELLQALSDPEQTKHLTIKARQELTEKLEQLRQMLNQPPLTPTPEP